MDTRKVRGAALRCGGSQYSPIPRHTWLYLSAIGSAGDGDGRKCSKKVGAGEGNRTLVISLEGFCSTIELHPRRRPQRGRTGTIQYRTCRGKITFARWT